MCWTPGAEKESPQLLGGQHPHMPRGVPVPPHCLDTGDTHGTQLVPGFLGLWMGCRLCNAQPHSCPSLSCCPQGFCECQAGTGPCQAPECQWPEERHLQPGA